MSDATKKYVNVVISKRLGCGPQRRKFVDIKTNHNNFRCQLDIGSDLSSISEKIGIPKLTHTLKVTTGVQVKNYSP